MIIQEKTGIFCKTMEELNIMLSKLKENYIINSNITYPNVVIILGTYNNTIAYTYDVTTLLKSGYKIIPAYIYIDEN